LWRERELNRCHVSLIFFIFRIYWLVRRVCLYSVARLLLGGRVTGFRFLDFEEACDDLVDGRD
jgi:hypothetical protein